MLNWSCFGNEMSKVIGARFGTFECHFIHNTSVNIICDKFTS